MDHDYPDTYDELPEGGPAGLGRQGRYDLFEEDALYDRADRKSTRLNSSHW